jgi:hypothetical protein
MKNVFRCRSPLAPSVWLLDCDEHARVGEVLRGKGAREVEAVTGAAERTVEIAAFSVQVREDDQKLTRSGKLAEWPSDSDALALSTHVAAFSRPLYAAFIGASMLDTRYRRPC